MADSIDAPPPEADQDRGHTIIVIYWAEFAVVLCFVLLRLQSRLIIRNIGIDDWLMFFSLILFAILCVLITLLCKSGGARHMSSLSPSQLSTVYLYFWTATSVALVAIAMGKISTAFLILRILGRASFWRKYLLYFGIAFSALAVLVTTVLIYVQCSPPRALWAISLLQQGATCWDPRVVVQATISMAAWNTLFDLALAALPTTIIWKLQMKLSRKVALCSVFALGVFASASSALRATKLNELNERSDMTWDTYDIAVLVSAEILIVTILGSLPTLKPAFDRYILRSNPPEQGYVPRDLERSGLVQSIKLGSVYQARRREETEDAWPEAPYGNIHRSRSNQIMIRRSYDIAEEVQAV